ncbi:sulfurtransferase-like selenium metabolism protein YedF [Halarcobacter sp.]|uniref:sulfurtransferase-like selenium metabolism protein YedF n=1 Tax=Halarcobacter sp. TaxID=2321133 RepID=UPI0029F4830C|nr:sulfurtransferase-like selenium metabolism protein YedF [Halarcobacter sp.]
MSKNKKTVFLKSDKIGEGELGSILINGFLKAMTEQENLPEKIICVNSAVLLTTADDENEVLNSLKILEQKGVQILSCGTCLDYYNLRDELKVGIPGNAIDTVNTLLNEEVVSF